MAQHDLHQFQSDFKKLVLTGQPTEQLVGELALVGDLPPANRLNIHRNNYRESLSSNLATHFPALKAFVGEEFVTGALKEYCTSSPPIAATLAHYGAEFAEFIEEHAVSAQLPYVPDIIRLEWALHELQVSNEATYDVEPAADAELSISENIRIIDSGYPLMSIWSAAMGHIPAEAVHLEQGGQMVIALLNDSEVSLMALDTEEAQFLRANFQTTDDDVQTEHFTADVARNLFLKRILVAS